MGFGIEVRNPNGTLQLDLGRQLPRFLGTASLNPASSLTGVIGHPAFTEGKPFFIPRNWQSFTPVDLPEILIYGNAIHWQFNGPYPSYYTAVQIDYGIY